MTPQSAMRMNTARLCCTVPWCARAHLKNRKQVDEMKWKEKVDSSGLMEIHPTVRWTDLAPVQVFYWSNIKADVIATLKKKMKGELHASSSSSSSSSQRQLCFLWWTTLVSYPAAGRHLLLFPGDFELIPLLHTLRMFWYAAWNLVLIPHRLCQSPDSWVPLFMRSVLCASL